jgi:predicted TIM-barrel fold metal-dependent hydrolase
MTPELRFSEIIKKKYDELGIEKGILLPEVSPECGFSIQSNEEVYELTKKYSDLFYWYCSLDPRMGNNSPSTDFSYFLNHYKSLGAKGMGELMANLYVDDPLMENLFFHCAECNMPVIIHIAPSTYGYYGIIDELGLPRLEKIIKKYPKLKILGHSQPFWAEIGNDVTDENRNSYPEGKVKEGRIVKLMREYENLYGDMSAGSGFNAISRDPEFGYRFIEEFKDKLFFGTDICAPHNNMLLSHWLDKAYEEKNISEDAYRKISRENAIRILGL